MTIYSQHASRGKIQILATYQGADAVLSSTVTSVSSSGLAMPIVDALNRISALVTVPLSIHDLRERRVKSYPREHIAALTDRASRADLLSGAHSLWYEYVRLELHQALADLDKALAAVPEPVVIAVNAELATEARELCMSLAEFSEGTPLPETHQRHWVFRHPFVEYDGGIGMLSREVREQLDRLEEGITTEEREKAVADLRVLATAYSRYFGEEAVFEDAHLTIVSEPYDSDSYFMSVSAPRPGDDGSGCWEIEISRWEADDPDDEDSSATGSTVIRCELPATPAAEEIVALLNQVEQEPDLLAKWAESTIGSPLAGTGYVVTKVYDS